MALPNQIPAPSAPITVSKDPATGVQSSGYILNPIWYRFFKNQLEATTTFLLAAANLSDINNAATARTNLGALGVSNNLSDVANAATSRTNLAVLGIANNLSDVANAATARTNLGALGTTGATSVTTLGTISTGTWQATVISPTYGGTGVNNGTKTITLGGNLTYSGAFTTTFTVTGNTSVTLPTSGTLATTGELVQNISQSANTVFAGPSSGSSTTPTFRALVGADLPSGTRVLISTQTANNSSSIDFTNLSSSYFEYIILIDSLLPATNATDLQYLISTDNGSSYISANYSYGGVSATDAGVAAGYGGAAVAQIVIATSLSNTAGYLAATINIRNTAQTNNRHLITWQSACVNSAAGFKSQNGAGMNLATLNIDAVRLKMSSGNITSGTIKLYGIKA